MAQQISTPTNTFGDGKNAPIIVIGMHRSGTSLITRTLESMGVFMGWRKQADEEALFFLNLNEWVMKCAQATWATPESIHDLLNHEGVRALVIERIKMQIASPRIISYMGWKNALLYRKMENLPMPYGWKDPRNVFTLPLWMEIFPRARVIHVSRHGVDIASSLRTREFKQIEKANLRNRRDKRQLRHWFRPMPIFMNSPGVLSLDYGLDLWTRYMSHSQQHMQELGTAGMDVKYESFLQEPLVELSRIAKFCGLSVEDEKLNHMVGNVKSDRAYAYLKNDELREFADRNRATLSDYGY